MHFRFFKNFSAYFNYNILLILKGTSNERSDEEERETQKYRRLSSPSNRYPKAISDEVVKGLNSQNKFPEDHRKARHTNQPINLYDKQPAVLDLPCSQSSYRGHSHYGTEGHPHSFQIGTLKTLNSQE